MSKFKTGDIVRVVGDGEPIYMYSKLFNPNEWERIDVTGLVAKISDSKVDNSGELYLLDLGDTPNSWLNEASLKAASYEEKSLILVKQAQTIEELSNKIKHLEGRIETLESITYSLRSL
jgi:hypothetical protein